MPAGQPAPHTSVAAIEDALSRALSQVNPHMKNKLFPAPLDTYDAHTDPNFEPVQRLSEIAAEHLHNVPPPPTQPQPQPQPPQQQPQTPHVEQTPSPNDDIEMIADRVWADYETKVLKVKTGALSHITKLFGRKSAPDDDTPMTRDAFRLEPRVFEQLHATWSDMIMRYQFTLPTLYQIGYTTFASLYDAFFTVKEASPEEVTVPEHELPSHKRAFALACMVVHRERTPISAWRDIYNINADMLVRDGYVQKVHDIALAPWTARDMTAFGFDYDFLARTPLRFLIAHLALWNAGVRARYQLPAFSVTDWADEIGLPIGVLERYAANNPESRDSIAHTYLDAGWTWQDIMHAYHIKSTDEMERRLGIRPATRLPKQSSLAF